MTREERRRQASEIYLADEVSDRCRVYFGYIKLAFEAGAEWSDNNPDLLSLWHDANTMPSDSKSIIYLTKNGKFGVISQVHSNKWDWYVAVKYSIIKWAYVDDLLPKGGDK